MSPCRIGSTDRGQCACALTVQRFSPTPTRPTKSRSMAIRFLRSGAHKNHSKREFLLWEPVRNLHSSFPSHLQRFWAQNGSGDRRTRSGKTSIVQREVDSWGYAPRSASGGIPSIVAAATEYRRFFSFAKRKRRISSLCRASSTVYLFRVRYRTHNTVPTSFSLFFNRQTLKIPHIMADVVADVMWVFITIITIYYCIYYIIFIIIIEGMLSLYIIVLYYYCRLLIRADAPRVLTSPPQSWGGAAFFPRPRAYLFGRRRQWRAETLTRRESLTAADDHRLPRPVTTHLRRTLEMSAHPRVVSYRVSPKTHISLGYIRPRTIFAVRRENHMVVPRTRFYLAIADKDALSLYTVFFFSRIISCPNKVVRLFDDAPATRMSRPSL